MTDPKNTTDADDVASRFSRTFCMSIGVIDGGDGMPVQLVQFSLSTDCIAEVADEYGCPAGEVAIFADYVPAGMTYDHSGPDWPTENGIDQSQIPDVREWATFPKEIDGLRVYYKRGAMVFAG